MAVVIGRLISSGVGVLRALGDSAIGAPAHLTHFCAQRQTKFLRGIRAARVVFEQRAA
jgi:hypothetical protein